MKQLYTAAQWFVTPVRVPVHPIEARRARVLSLITLLTFLVTVTSSVILWLQGSIAHVSDLSMLMSFLMVLAARLLSYYYAGRVVAALISALPYIWIIAIPDFAEYGTILFVCAVAVMIASFFTSPIFTLNIAVLNLLTAFTQHRIMLDASVTHITSLIPYVLIFAVIALLWAYINEHDLRQQSINTEQLQGETARILTIADMLPEALLFILDDRILYANQNAYRMLRYASDQELLDMPVEQVLRFTPDPAQRIESLSATLVLRQRAIIYPQGGNSYPITVITTTVPFAGKIGMLYVLRPEAEEMLLFQRIIESARLPAVATTPPGEDGLKIVYANPAFCTQTGYSSTELLGADYTLLYGPQTNPDFLRSAQIAFDRGDMVTEGETILYNKDGEPFHGIWQVRTLRVQDVVTHYIFTLRDTNVINQEQKNLAFREEQDRIVSDMMSDYTYSLEVKPDKSLRFQWIAGAYERITGRKLETLMQQASWFNLVHPDERTLYRLRQMALLEGESRSIEYRVMHPDGTTRWVQDSARPVQDSSGQIVQILGAAHDITERIIAQEALKAHVVQQAVVAELGLLALSYDNQQMLMHHAVVLCEQVLEANFSMALAYVPQGNTLRIIAATEDASVIHIGDMFDAGSTKSLCGYALATLEPVVSANLHQETRFQPLQRVLNAGMVSGIGIVIHGADQPFGALAIYSERPRTFTDDDIYFLQSVANVLGTFVERSRAQESERQQREFAEALRDAAVAINSRLELSEVLRRILESLKHVVPQHESSVIQLLDEISQTYRFVSYLGVPEEAVQLLDSGSYHDDDMPLLSTMAQRRKPLIIDDVMQEPLWRRTNAIEDISSYIGAPIIVEDRCIGFIHLNSSKKAAFLEKDGERLQIFADKTGNAILNARRADELDRMVKVRTAELKQEREQLGAMLSSTGEGIFYTENNYILFANQAFADMTGYEMGELIGASTDLIYPAGLSAREQQKMQSIPDVIMRGETWRDELRIGRKDGSSFSAGLTVTRVGGPNQDARRSVTIVRDISTEKELERLQTRFIANAAHELRSPITNLNTRMYLIRRQPEAIDAHMEVLEEVIARMNRLVSDLLDISYIQNGNLGLRQEGIIIQNVVQSVCRVLEAEATLKQIDFNTQIPLEPIQIWADPHRLEQVLVNIINNAINYTPEGGYIKVSMERSADSVVIAVEDSGQGIPPEDLEYVFQPFYRVERKDSKKGTGLGLSISKEIVELHGGTLSVESQLNIGSTFSIHLPVLES